jgi:hypothetical protein
MHITADKGVNVAALTSALRINDKLLSQWAVGCVELYQAISDWAGAVTEEEEFLSQAIAKHEDGWPGVFAYEVAECVGTCLREHIKRDYTCTPPDVRRITRTAIVDFCHGAEHPRRVIIAYLKLSLKHEEGTKEE